MSYDNKYEKYKEQAFSLEVWHLIKKAIDDDIDVEGIADTRYDYFQIEQLLIARRNGMDITPIADPSLSAETMQRIREHIFEEMGIYDEYYENVRRKWLNNIVRIMCIFIFVIGTASLIYIFRSDIEAYFATLTLNLSTKEITIEAGESFDPFEYIEKYSEDAIIKIEGENKVNTKQVGTYTVTYIISNGKKEEKYQMLIRVKDTTPPNLQLKQSHLVLEEGSNIEPLDYVENAYDLCDGDLTKQVTYRWSSNNSIVYKVKDSSNNEIDAKLEIEWKEKPKIETQATPKKEESVQENISSSKPLVEQIEQHQTQEITVTAQNRKLPFEEGKTFEDTHQVCVSLGTQALQNGQANSYECNVYADANGIAIGYDLIFN